MFSTQYDTELFSHRPPGHSPRKSDGWPSRKNQILALLGMLLIFVSIPLMALIVFGRNWGFVSAARSGEIATVRKDLNIGMDPNTESKGLHAISGAAYGGHAAIVRLLLERGTNPDDGMLQAVMMNRADIVALLIQHGASVNRLPGHGISPLQEATDCGYLHIARLLRQAGAKE